MIWGPVSNIRFELQWCCYIVTNIVNLSPTYFVSSICHQNWCNQLFGYQLQWCCGYIDVGDGGWRRNVLVTTLRRWWRFWPFLSPISSIFEHKLQAPTTKRCHQYRNSVTNLLCDIAIFLNVINRSPTIKNCHQYISSPTSVTNINVVWIFMAND